jgi:hypothetical protein
MLTVSLEGADYEALRADSEARGVSIASLIREAVGMYLTKRRKG